MPRLTDPWICDFCTAGAHADCFSRAWCACVHAQARWLLPERRAALRAGAEPRDDFERDYQEAYRAHQDEREAADARRG